MRRWLAIYSRFDWSLLIAALSLTSLGLLVLFGISMSRASGDLFQFKKQILGAAIGAAIALLLAWVDYRQLRSLALPIFLAVAACLAAVLVLGTTHRGGGRWFVLGTLSFQPVELAKLTLAIYLAALFARHARQRLTWAVFGGSALAVLVYAGLVLLQPDFGSAVVLVAIWFAMVLFCGLPRHAWWILLVTILATASLLWTVGLRPYQRDRITSFLFPKADPYGAAYNVAQAQIAIGSGGWLGKGIGEGSQARLRFLPEASTDFIFAVVGEELGFVGILVLLGLFGLLFFRYLRIAKASDDPFAAILLVGLSAVIAFHLFVNAGMNLGILPVTGIPLPFASAAASSLITMFISVGIAEAIAVQSKGRY